MHDRMYIKEDGVPQHKTRQLAGVRGEILRRGRTGKDFSRLECLLTER